MATNEPPHIQYYRKKGDSGVESTLNGKPYQCNPGTTNGGKEETGRIWPFLTAVMAGYMTGEALMRSKRQYDIAEWYWKLANEWHRLHVDHYEPVEDQAFDDAQNWEPGDPQYDFAEGVARNTIRAKFSRAYEAQIRCTSEYCTGRREQMLRDLALAEARESAFAAKAGREAEREYIRNRVIQRWKQLFGVVAIGRHMSGQPLEFMSQPYSIYAQLGEYSYSSAMGNWRAFGYWTQRNETKYPSLKVAWLPPETPTSPTPPTTFTPPPETPEYGSMSGTYLTREDYERMRAGERTNEPDYIRQTRRSDFHFGVDNGYFK